jgi:hypothetical protein
MIVFNHNLLFLHSPKTAGTSIIAALEASLPEARVAGVAELGTHHPHLDQALNYVRAVIGQTDLKCVFVVARDPFDREVSMYNYFRNVLHGSALAKRNLNNVGLQAAVELAAKLPFRDYIKSVYAAFGTCDLWRSRFYYESETFGRMENLRILRLETIESELAHLLEDYLTTPLALPYLNRGEGGELDTSYDEETRAIVVESYAWIFAMGLYAYPADDAVAIAIRDLGETVQDVGELGALHRTLRETEHRLRRAVERRSASPS